MVILLDEYDKPHTDFVNDPDMDDTPPEGFLYQSGYLTLRSGEIDDLSLNYPIH